MFEYILIILSILNLLIIFSFPLNLNFKMFNSFTLQLNFYDYIILNSIIFLNFLLILSFFPLNISYVFYLIIFFSLCIFFYNFKNFLVLKKNMIFLFFFFFILFCLFVKIAFDPVLAWDGAHHWIMKAKVFFDGGYLKNIKGVIMDFYPHLGTYLWGFFWKNSFLEIEYFGRFPFIFLFILCFFSCFEEINLSKHVFKLGLVVSLIYLSTEIMLFKGYQEYLLFFIFFASCRIFLLFEKNKLNNTQTIFYILIFALTSNIFLWIKQEGFFHFFIINVIFLFYSKINFKYKLMHLVLLVLLIALFYFIKNYFFGSFHFHQEIIKDNTIENFKLDLIFFKIILISKYIAITFFKHPIFIVILICLAILFFLKKNFYKKNNFLISFFIMEFGLFYLIFLWQDADLKWLLPLTFSRVMFPISGFCLYIINDCIKFIEGQRE